MSSRPDDDLLRTGPSRREVIATGAAALAAAAIPGLALAQGAPRVRLRVMETTDLHVNVVPHDYYRDAADDTLGLAKTATLIKAARAEAPNSILLDNGDLIQGSPMGDFIAYKKGLNPGDTHPMFAAMNGLDYACSTLGNHEFNYGLGFLDTALSAAKFPVVCANVFKPDGTPLVKPWTIVERAVVDEAGAAQTVRIGIIGFTPPQIVQWDKAHLDGKATTIDIVDAARRYVPELRAAGPDIVVALCHSGIAGGERRGGEENAALHLAAVEGIDVLLTGHLHLVFPGDKSFNGIAGIDNVKGTLHGKPAVMPGFWGSHLGIVDLVLERKGSGWGIADFKVEARPIFERVDRRVVPKAQADAAVLAAVREAHQATLDYVRQPVSATSAAITSYFAMIADDPSVQIVSQAQSWYVADLLKQTPHKDLPLLSAVAPFKFGGRGGPTYFTDIKPGPIAIKDIADIYIYPNTVRAVKITGAQVREWLERSAGAFNRIDPARTDEQELINTRFPAFNFDIIDGVTYRIDVTQPSRYDDNGKLVAPDARRIVDLAYKGKPIDDRAEFVVATNNYRASGGGNFPGNDGTTIVIDAPDLTRDVIVRYLLELKTVNPTADGNWSLAPLPRGVNVTFVTGPAARDKVPPGLKVEPAGDAADGFVKYRLAAG